jgi:3-oxoacyl-[acyl-carrier-protein] synthase II
VNDNEPVWITGIGAATPLGNDFATIAGALLAGRSGVRAIEAFDVSQHPSRLAAGLGAVPCPPGFAADAFARRDRVIQADLWNGTAALRDAGLWDGRAGARVGLVLGGAAEWLLNWELDAAAGGRLIDEPQREGPPRVKVLQAELGLSGPAVMVSAACASGNHALALARQWLRMGWVDVCLAGASDMTVTPMTLAAFANLRALSRQNDRPEAASRPFDRDRDGFVIGEGGALFVLERAADARRRGAQAYAEVAGFGASSDAYHLVIPSPDPAPAVAALRQALADARLNPDEVDYVNAHGTGTPVGDVCETNVLRGALGSAVDHTPVSSTKSMTGHLLAAAASVEAIACVAAIRGGAIPPTINLDNIDPQCVLCHVPNEARPHKVRAALSNSFGFGGSNTSLVLRAV